MNIKTYNCVAYATIESIDVPFIILIVTIMHEIQIVPHNDNIFPEWICAMKSGRKACCSVRDITAAACMMSLSIINVGMNAKVKQNGMYPNHW